MKRLKMEYLRIGNLFRLERENNVIKDIMLRTIRNLFEYEEEENYYKLVIINYNKLVSNFSSNNYIEHEV